MKKVRKLKSTAKAVAGSALLVGATLTGAAGLASASQHDSGSMDLGDYPQPFVNDDGEVDSTIVVGSQGKTADVVGAINVAGSLGNAAYMEESVDVDVSGAVTSWTAENGITLNRANSNIFFPESTAAEQTGFDGQDIEALATQTFSSEDNTEVEVEHDLTVGDNAQDFSTAGDSDDPLLHVNVPTSAEVGGSNLFEASADFGETIDFTAQSQDDNDFNSGADVALEDGDEIRMLGNTYTYSSESQGDELVLYGSSETFEVNTGSEETVTVDGEEHTFSVDYVTDTSDREATIVVDGQTRSVEDGDTVTVNGQEVRVRTIYRTGPDGQGRVEFSIGSEEVVITDSGELEVDGETVDGVDVNVQTGNLDNSETFSAVEGFEFAFGAEDSDEDYIEAGGMYEAPVFGLEFHYGGLAPNAAENAEETVTVEAQEDDTATLDMTTSDGEEGTVTLIDEDYNFGPEDGTIAEYEGQSVGEDDQVVLNANEEAALYEVTNVDDTDLTNDETEDGEVSVTLENVVTGDSVTVEEDGLDLSQGTGNGGDTNGDGTYTLEDESINGNDFDVTWEDGDMVSFERSGEDSVQVFPSLYTATDSAVALTDGEANNAFSIEGIAVDGSSTHSQTFELPSSVSSGDNEVTVEVYESKPGDYDGTINSGSESGGDYGSDPIFVRISGAEAVGNGNSDTWIDLTAPEETHDSVEFRAGETVYTLDVDTNTGTSVSDKTLDFDVALAATQDDDLVPWNGDGDPDTDTRDVVTNPATLVVQNENNDDEEEAYVLETNVGDNTATVSSTYTGVDRTGTLDDEDVTVGYDEYGAYTEYDEESSDSESFTLNLPGSQATAGMAVTGAEGSLSSSGSASGDYTTATPTGWPGAAQLDTNVDAEEASNLIMVGGPAVNTLVSDLASENKTWTADQYEEDTWVLDLVEGFSSGQHALVVAGYGAEDTRAASQYLANYADNQDELSGETTVSMTTGQ